jgi:hypothetical protein
LAVFFESSRFTFSTGISADVRGANLANSHTEALEFAPTLRQYRRSEPHFNNALKEIR